MSEIKTRKYNKGEWSEILACFKILSAKEWKINFGDGNGNKTEDYLLITDLFHINEKYHYCLNNNQYYLKHNDNLIAKYTFKETFEIIEKLKKEILTGNRAFSIQDTEIQNFFDKHKITKLKTGAENKSDIYFSFRDNKSNKKYNRSGFNIKSYFGSNPTLINPSAHTIFVYEIKLDSNKINKIISKKKPIKKILNEIIREKGEFTYLDNTSQSFNYNLKTIDTRFPEIFSKILLYKYVHSFSCLKDFPECIGKLDIEIDNDENKELLKLQIKKFLFASTTGMNPGTKWDGDRNCDGFIVLKKDMDLITYGIYNHEKEKMLKDYLFYNSYIDTPSTKNAGTKYKEMVSKKIILDKLDNKYKLYLNFQIRVK